MPEKKLYLLDAMALIYRAYFAFSKNPRYNSAKMNTSAIFGFTNTLVDLLKSENPSHIAVAFDTHAPTIRHEEFAEYKAQREAMPEDIAIAIPYVKKLLEAFNIPVVAMDGFEADDVIGTLAKQAEKEGFKVFMVTPDKDFGQLVSDNIYIYKPARGGKPFEILGVKEVCEKFNIQKPEQLADIIGLWGDASDNIPGVPGIGEVWAKKLIGQFATIENLIKNADAIENKKMQEKIKTHAKQALMSKNLGIIVTDAPVGFDASEYKYKGYDKKKLLTLFQELEFKGLAERVFRKAKEEDKSLSVTNQPDLFSSLNETEVLKKEIEKRDINKYDKKYHLVDTPEQVEALIEKIGQCKAFCFDAETTGLNITKDEIVGLAFSFKPHQAFYMPLTASHTKAFELLKRFAPFFESDDIQKIGHNLKFDISMLKNYDIDVKGPMFDTMLAHYILEPDMRHNLDALADTFLDYKTIPIESLIGKKGKNQLSIESVDIELVKKYACEDADVTLQLKEIFEKKLEEEKLIELFYNVEVPLVKVLSEMELEGVKVDTEMLKEISKELDAAIATIKEDVYDMAGVNFNLASPKQLGEVLFDKLQIVKNPKKTKTKQYSTSEDVLTKLADKHPIVEKILDYRSLSKLQTTYIDALPQLISKRTGRIHSSFNQAVTATGRLSSANPNLQNIPIRTERGKEVRKAFVPRDDNYVLLAADYSQIELRIMAELSKDEALMTAFKEGLDIHAATAARIYNIDIKDVSSNLRRLAKTVNFGIIYGISAFGLSERIKEINRNDAAQIIEQYFRQYPGIKTYMDETIAFAREHSYVETILGRKRFIPDINSGNAMVRGYAERNAINAPIQGSAADMIKIAMSQIYNAFVGKKLKSKMIMQVHDELVFDVLKEEVEEVKVIVEDKLLNSMKLNVPLVVDMKTGQNWLEAH